MTEQRSDITVASAGIQATKGLPTSTGSLEVLAQQGISCSFFRSQPVTQELINRATYVFAMTQQHRDFLTLLYPKDEEKFFLITEWTTRHDISDPIGGSIRDYQYCCDTIKVCLQKILSFIDSQIA